MKKRNVIVCLILVIVAFCSGFGTGMLLVRNENQNTAVNTEVTEKVMDETKIVVNETDDEENAEDNVNSLEPLESELEKQIKEFSGEWAIYVENLESGDCFEVNNKKMVSASLIKLFIMGSVYEAIEDGTIKEEDVKQELESMITVSDNEASNVLVAKLGGGKYTDMKGEAFQKGLKIVNEYAKKFGYTDTEQQRDMKNSRPKPVSEQNYTSVRDCGKFLSRIYHEAEKANEPYVEMIELLQRQTRRGKIPAGLPQGVVCANKTGELSNVENDVAIVFSEDGDYVICVMSNDVPDTSVASKRISEISEKVYNFFNQDKTGMK